ncbi:MAG: hypothetical protein ACR2JC_21215 [Chloroflexota bacterium]
MPAPHNRWRREPQVFATDERPGANTFVYCKGCGKQLESRARVSQPRAAITSMMCEPCCEIHGHQLMPSPGSPTFCYRCGRPDQLFVSDGFSPVTYHVCPNCVPDVANRYRAHDFETPKPAVPEAT